ncbi:synaptic vesicle 2-related protein-like isoform X1 [Amphiura filiformis]|uniref:synaptic vesicle 2-related protein-like isoform X1 n=1 Tax=Amphiura filiformis TaxID=82378 RepID=UPI003B20CE57
MATTDNKMIGMTEINSGSSDEDEFAFLITDEFTVEQAIDHMGFGRFHVKIALINAALTICSAGIWMLLSILGPELECKWHLAKWQQALITTIVFVGYLFGSPLWGKFADLYGRKTALIMIGLWLFVFGLLTSFSPNYIWILSLRGLVGFGIGGLAQTAVLSSEFYPSTVRGFWMTFVGFSWIIGIVWVVAVGYFVMPTLGWRWLLVIAALPLIIFIACCYFLPESPYYHVACGNKEAALDILKLVAKTNGKSLPPGDLKVGSGSGDRGTFVDLYSDRKTSITTSLLLFIWFAMAFIYYGVVLLTTEMFSKGHSCAATPANADETCFDSCQLLTKKDYSKIIITTLAEFPGHLITLGIIDFAGRKKTMSIHNMLCAGSILLLLICTKSQMMLTVFLFLARGHIAGAFAAIYIYTPEVYPTHVRGIGLGTCGSISRIACIITPFVAQVFLDISPSATIAVYAGFGFAAAVAIMFLPIETKGRNLVSQLKETKSSLKSSEEPHPSLTL